MRLSVEVGYLLLDNNSTDKTVILAGQFDNTTILQTSLPFGEYGNKLKRRLVEQFGRNSWCIVADIDERFDYPLSDQISLKDFLVYLNQEGFTVVVAQMLDLFSEGVVEEWP